MTLHTVNVTCNFTPMRKRGSLPVSAAESKCYSTPLGLCLDGVRNPPASPEVIHIKSLRNKKKSFSVKVLYLWKHLPKGVNLNNRGCNPRLINRTNFQPRRGWILQNKTKKMTLRTVNVTCYFTPMRKRGSLPVSAAESRCYSTPSGL